MKLLEGIIDKDEKGVYLQIPCDKKYFTDDCSFMNAYYAHEAINQLYEQNRKIAVLERALKLACDWFRQFGFIGDQTETEYFIRQAEKEIDNGTLD